MSDVLFHLMEFKKKKNSLLDALKSFASSLLNVRYNPNALWNSKLTNYDTSMKRTIIQQLKNLPLPFAASVSEM